MGEWRCPVVAGAVGRVLQQGEGCSWSSAVLDFSSYLLVGLETLEGVPSAISQQMAGRKSLLRKKHSVKL